MIKMAEYAKRREALIKQIGSKGIVILPSAPEVIRNGDSSYFYRQNSDFYYLTGFSEPEALMVLAPKHEDGEYILFNREKNPEREIWDGPRAGQLGACKKYLADKAYPYSQWEDKLFDLLSGRETIYYPVGRYFWLDEAIMRTVNRMRDQVRAGVKVPLGFVDVLTFIHEMRLFKSDAEIEAMQSAVDISASAHIEAMQSCRPGMNERELDAVLAYEFTRRGAKSPAYSSIVGAGENACILHYIDNNSPIKNGDLVLIDAGAEVDNYASDITRTFPANGKFTKEQAAIYDIVLEAQLAGIKAIKPGVSWYHTQEVVIKVITQGLVDVGILKGKVSKLIEERAYYPFYMHGSGHWLGLDVHDAGSYKIQGKWRLLEERMVLTIEPGIYISAQNKKVHKRWHNIGIRIEDDVVVTKKGNIVLSAKIPKKRADIENLMGG